MQNIKLSGRNLNLILIAWITVLLIITLFMSGCTGPKVDGNQNVTNGTIPAGNESTGGIQNPPAEVVEIGDNIEVNYVGRFENGTVFDESKGEPLKFTVGAGNMIKGFDEAVVGMKAGEKKNVKILPGNAYGMPESMPRTQNLTYDQFVQAVGKEPVLNMILNVQEIYWPMTVIKIDNITREIVSDDLLKNTEGVEILPGIGACSNPGKVTILEFSDFQCPYCSRAVPTINKIKETYGNKVEITFKQMPLPFHEYAQKAAEASECARDQGKFWEYHDKLFANQGALSVNNLNQYAVELGLNKEKFNSCLDNGEKQDKVKADSSEAGKYGISGTPGFVLNCNIKIAGAYPYETFKSAIDSLLESNKTVKYQEVTITIRHDPAPNTEYAPQLKVFKVSENEMEIGHSLSGETLVFDITIVNIKKTNVRYIPDLSPQEGFATFESDSPAAPICADGKKPVVYMFSTTGCPHCIWVKETFDKVAKEYAAGGRIDAYHWELDTGDNTLTPEVEASVPDSDRTFFKKFSPGGGVPTFVFGCKYYRLGTGYEPQNDLASEEKEFRELIEQMIKSSESV